MSTHDYDLANQSGASFRADLNLALDSIATWNSSASAPTTTFARMRWIDTTNGVLKRRNAANSAWIVIGTEEETLVVSRASNTMLDVGDSGKTFLATAGFTQTLDNAATLGEGWSVRYRNDSGSGTIVVDPSGAELIDGASSISLTPGQTTTIICTGSAFKTVGDRGFPSGTALVFQQTSAPIGWTKSTTHNNKALRVVSGTASAGGSTAFTTVFGSGKTTAGHALTIAQMPAHVHGRGESTVQNLIGGGSGAFVRLNIHPQSDTDSAGGDQAHTHDLSLDLQYMDVIVATKD